MNSSITNFLLQQKYSNQNNFQELWFFYGNVFKNREPSCSLATKLCPILLWPHGLDLARLLCAWDFPGNNTGVGCHFVLQGIFPILNPYLLSDSTELRDHRVCYNWSSALEKGLQAAWSLLFLLPPMLLVMHFQNGGTGNPLAVPWWGLCASTAEGAGLCPLPRN